MSTSAAPMMMTTREIGPEVVHESTVNTTTTTHNYNNMSQGQIDNLFGRPDVHTETRKVSSVIVEQKYLGEVPTQDEVRYVEVPTIQEEVKYVTKKETREKLVERKVPMVEYVERVVEVPRIEYIDRQVEVPVYTEVFVDQHVQQVVDRPVERIVEVPVYKDKIVERVVEVPGGVIEVPKPYAVHVPKEVYNAVEAEVPIIVAQTIKPVIVETNKQMIVDVMDYEPEVVPVDVHVAKPVASALELIGQTESRHRLVNISSAQYNSILRQLNVHMDEKIKHTLPYVSERGQVQFVDERNLTYIVAPEHIVIEGYSRRAPTIRPLNIATHTTGTSTVISSSQTKDIVPNFSGNITYGTAGSAQVTGQASVGQYYTTTGPSTTTTTVKQTTTSTQPTTTTTTATSLKPMTTGYQTSTGYQTTTPGYQTATPGYQTTSNNYQASYNAAVPSTNFQTTVGAYRVGVTTA